MKKTVHIYRCDICDHEESESPAQSIVSFTIEETDFAGHTESIEKHICLDCVSRITKRLEQKGSK